MAKKGRGRPRDPSKGTARWTFRPSKAEQAFVEQYQEETGAKPQGALSAALRLLMRREGWTGASAASETTETRSATVLGTLRNIRPRFGRIRIADLTRALPGVALKDIHEALTRLQEAGKLTLMKMDDPKERTDDDDQAALQLAGGNIRHLVYLRD